ncbi:MAG: DNA polymerase III subunit [bacterium]
MFSFSNIKGQDYAVKILKNQFKNSRLPHFYIFHGQKGVGKQSTAKAFAKLLNCNSPTIDIDSCNECRSCRLIEHENNPDVINLDFEWQAQILGTKEKKRSFYYKIETIHELVRRLNFVSGENIFRVIIFDQADRLTDDASGALLKTLEEPPGRTIFIFITDKIHKILPTIISRSQMINFYPLSKKLFKEVAANLSYEVTDQDYYSYNASPGLLAESSKGEDMSGGDIFVNFLKKGANSADMIEWLDTLTGSKDTMDDFLKGLLETYRRNKYLTNAEMDHVKYILQAGYRHEHFVNPQLICLDLFLKMKEL